MREIKFRAWDLNNRKMYDSYIVDENGSFCVDGDFTNNCECSEEDRVIQMQFTGLKDKKGKEIYEGDIIEQIFYGDEISKIMLVVEDIRNLESIRCGSSKENKIIGNIYKNPEFAEQKLDALKQKEVKK